MDDTRNKKFWEELIIYFTLKLRGIEKEKIRGTHRYIDSKVIS
jgi:hypothetical protein